jgi:hypothetical protein
LRSGSKLCLVVLVSAVGGGMGCKSPNAAHGTAGTSGVGRGGADAVAGTGGASGSAAGTGGLSNGKAGSGVWQRVANTGPCVLEQADAARLEVLPLTWSACGAGCTTTPAKVLATDGDVYDMMASARVDGSDVVVRFGTVSSGNYYLLALRRLSDGKLLAAARAPGPTQTTCGFATTGANAPHTFGFLHGDPPATSGGTSTSGTLVVGLVGPAGLAWSPPVSVPLPLNSTFENDLGWGIAFYDGSLRLKSPVDGSAFTVIDQGTFPVYSTAGWGKLIVSNPGISGSADTVIRAWEPDRPSRTVFSKADTGIPRIALSDTTLAWVGTHGPNRVNGAYTAAELYWAATPAGKDTITPTGSVSLPATSGLASLQVFGDFAAATGNDDRIRQVVFVVRLSDGKRWTIGPRAGATYREVLVVSSQVILVGEVDDSGDPKLGWQIQRLTRFDLSQLDQLAAAW